MFGNRNYSGYSLSSSSREDQFLADALTVSKLKGSKLNAYFSPIRRSDSAQNEIEKRNNHFEEFKKAIRSKKSDDSRSKLSIPKDMDKYVFDAFVRRYRVKPMRSKHETDSKPAMRRAPLKTIKTVGVEVPSVFTEKTVYTVPKRKNIEMFVEIAKPVRKREQKREVQKKVEFADEKVEAEEETEEDEESKKLSQSLIEQQLLQTRNEIDVASNQLERIKNLLSQRKTCLSPVNEEVEEIEEKANKVKDLVDKKCSPIQPRTQWTVKSFDLDRSSYGKKKKLMSTLNHLNQRLQRIQEKYFNEPKVKYKSINDFSPIKSKDTLQTLYKNYDYLNNTTAASNILKVKEDSSVFDPETLNFMHQLIKKTEKLTQVNDNKKHGGQVKTRDSVVVLMPPIEEFRESEPIVTMRDIELNTSDTGSKGILKKVPKSTDMFDTVLEAPALQDSICKSNYLMKEFNLNSKDKDFDLSVLIQKNDAYTSTENFKKNVRFSRSVKKVDSYKDTRLNSNIDIALKNSLFYHDGKNQEK